MYKILKIILTNILIFLFFLIPIEIIFGNWLKKDNLGNLLIPKYSRNIITNPPYEWPYNNGIYSRDKYGFRANNQNLKEIDILVIGGSTTAERYVQDEFIWTKVLERNLQKYNIDKKILNAGIGGQTSFGHIKMFDLWFSNLENLKPQIIIFYIGINDALFMNEHSQAHSQGRIFNNINIDSLVPVKFHEKIVQNIKNNSALHLLYLIVRGNIISKKNQIGHNINLYNDKDITSSTVSKNKDLLKYYEQPRYEYIKEYLYYYKNNLKKLLKITNERNAKVIFVTQVVAKNNWLVDQLSVINKETISFCVKHNISCLDIEKYNIFEDKKDFFDTMHTTPFGSEKVGKIIAKFIYEKVNLN